MIVRWDPMGYVSQTIQDLSIPRNGQDTFVLLLDRTIGHHDSAQLVIKYSPAQPIVSSMFHQILIRLRSFRVSCISSSASLSSSFDLDHVSSWLLYCSFPFSSHDPHASLLLSLTLLFKSESFFSFYCIPWLSLLTLVSNLPLYFFGSLFGALVGTNSKYYK